MYGHKARQRLIPVSSCICSRAWGSPRKRSRTFSTRNRVYWVFPESAMTCATCFHGTSRDARLAVDYFVYRVTKEIGALVAVLGGIDGMVFTAGIGENSAEIRRRICESAAWLGLELDEEANTSRGPASPLRSSKVSTWVIPTNEELMIARHTGNLLGLR